MPPNSTVNCGSVLMEVGKTIKMTSEGVTLLKFIVEFIADPVTLSKLIF